MSYRIAGIGVHKKMLAVVVSDVEGDGEYQFERRLFGSTPGQLRLLAEWLLEQEVEEVVMDRRRSIGNRSGERWSDSGSRHARSVTAQARWRERCIWPRHSQTAGLGAQEGLPRCRRLVKRLVARELTLSFVPDAEQRLWRTVMRRKYQLTRNRVQLQNRLECLLEEAHIKLSSFVSNLLGVSARRMLKALAEGETNPASLAALADRRLRATPEQLCDALGACKDLHPVYRRLLKMMLEELRLIEEHIGKLDKKMADLLDPYQDQIKRLAESIFDPGERALSVSEYSASLDGLCCAAYVVETGRERQTETATRFERKSGPRGPPDTEVSCAPVQAGGSA